MPMLSKMKIAKVVLSAFFVFATVALPAKPVFAQDAGRVALLAQIEAVKRQIILLQIQWIQLRIFELQQQLSQIDFSGQSQTTQETSFIDVIYPVGGEKMENRHSYYILWEARGMDNVSIELKSPENAVIIANNVDADSGRYYWNVGNISGNKYRIRIFDADNSSFGDQTGEFLIFDNSEGNRCSDGTLAGECSDDRPMLCFDTEIGLVNACHSCGCPSGQYCGSDSKCR